MWGQMAKIAVTLVNEDLAHARNGEVVLYKRGDSKRWQARFKLKDLKWHRVATKHVNIQYAAETACEAYDRARFLFDEKVPITSKRFDSVADIAVDEMERQLAAGVGKSVYNDYISVIKKYLKPFFGAKSWHSPKSVDKYDVKTEMENCKCNERNMPPSSKTRLSNKSSIKATQLSM